MGLSLQRNKKNWETVGYRDNSQQRTTRKKLNRKQQNDKAFET